MIYKKISSKVCIARVFDRFHITYSDWISRAPNWINSAVSTIGAYTQLEQTREELTISDYKAALPTGIDLIEGVSFNGVRLPRIDKINTINDTDLDNQTSTTYSYQLDNNGYIYTTFDDETIVLYYRSLPVELDSTTGLYFPAIQNNEYLLEAIDYYILFRLIQRGHKVEGYSLNGAGEYNNPARLWEKHRRIARSKVQAFDEDELNQISKLMRTFLIDQNKYYKNILYTQD